jgi:hypothetical protein
VPCNHGHAVGGARQRLIDLRRGNDQRFIQGAEMQRDVERDWSAGEIERLRVADHTRRRRHDGVAPRLEIRDTESAIGVSARPQRRGCGTREKDFSVRHAAAVRIDDAARQPCCLR